MVSVWGADAVNVGGRQHRLQRYRELWVGPARSENLCMRGIFVCENREVPCLSVLVDQPETGRLGNTEVVRLG